VLLLAAACPLCAADTTAQHKEAETAKQLRADITAPYAGMLGQILDNVGEGDIDGATTLMVRHLRGEQNEANTEKIRRLFAKIYGSAKEYDGNELVAVRRLTNRIHVAYFIVYYENADVLFRFEMSEFRGRWRIADIDLTNDFEKIENSVPLEMIAQ